MSLLKYTITFLAGIYVGQEYHEFPNVKNISLNIYRDFYKKLNEKPKNDK